MKNPVGGLLLFLTLMISVMAAYINLGNMLYGVPLRAINGLASAAFLLAWIALSFWSIRNKGRYSPLMSIYWFFAFSGAAFCVITVSGMTGILDFMAYFLLFLLVPLFGFRPDGMGDLTWAMVMAGISLCFAAVSFVASAFAKNTDSESTGTADASQALANMNPAPGDKADASPAPPPASSAPPPSSPALSPETKKPPAKQTESPDTWS